MLALLLAPGIKAQGVRLERPMSPQEQISVIDTAVVYNTIDTTKHVYAYDGNGKMTSDLTQKWTYGLWQDSLRETRTYDAGGNLNRWLSASVLRWTNTNIT